MLLRQVRKTLKSHRSTRLSEALGFLHHDFDARHYYWEIVEVCASDCHSVAHPDAPFVAVRWQISRKLCLIGFFGLIAPGTILQLMTAVCFIIAFNIIKQVRSPYHLLDDDYFALACDVSLLFVFVFSLLLKYDKLTTAVLEFLPQTLKDTYDFNFIQLTIGLFTSVISALVFLSLVALQQILVRHDDSPSSSP